MASTKRNPLSDPKQAETPKESAAAKTPSAANAKAAFKNFSLSKLSADNRSRTYFSKGDNVTSQQRNLIKKQLEDFKSTESSRSSEGGLSITILKSNSDAESNSESDTRLLTKGEAKLAGMISALEKAKKGTEFYTPRTSLKERLNIQDKVDAIINQIKEKEDKNA